jgi:hypothetical protein
MDMRNSVYAACALALALATAGADAQVSQPTPAASTGGPGRGMTMAQVEQRYGEPARKLDAVGQPPITRWVYPGFVVFFEGNLVIHTVNQASPAGS